MAIRTGFRAASRHPMRGRLLDRNGEVLATNLLSYQTSTFLPRRLARGTLGIAARSARRRGWMCPSASWSRSRRNSVGRTAIEFRWPDPLSSASRCCVFKEQGTAFERHQHLDVDYLRFLYRNGTLASHLLGYTSSHQRGGIRPPGPRGLPGFRTASAQRLEAGVRVPPA